MGCSIAVAAKPTGLLQAANCAISYVRVVLSTQTYWYQDQLLLNEVQATSLVAVTEIKVVKAVEAASTHVIDSSLQCK